ncbi:redoxin domain-containing protein [Terrimonas rubra]|uniref:Redoxin domain-containing protein n=1 Tax=Terrimonas rubra TaxID=1035890 RepID=A0ABW6A462_9BACT
MRSVTVFFILLMTLGVMAQPAKNEKAEAYNKIIQTGTATEKTALMHELLQGLKTAKTEEPYSTAINLLQRLGFKNQADSVLKKAEKRFPKGALARTSFVNERFYKAETTVAKEKIYRQILQKWPVKNFPGSEITYDYMSGSLATDFAKEGNTEKAIYYLHNLNERFWRGNGYIPVGKLVLEAGDTATAAALFKTALEDAQYYATLPEDQKDNKARFAAMGYPGAVSAYVDILVGQGNYKEALDYIEQGMKLAPELNDGFLVSYYKSLAGLQRNLEAYNELSKIYKKGNFEYEASLKDLYVKLNGSETGFDRHIASLKQALLGDIRTHIKGIETDRAAPGFKLVNMEGVAVSLADLKGKVVVVDFWATWCQPCIRSFPGMKASQEMYAHDKDVQFLFIDTWEKVDDYKEKVAAFIKKNNYPFEVLFDDAATAGTNPTLADQFLVKGIPAKFIIDKEGSIRYALMGSSSNVEYIKMEMKEMIEAARLPRKK